MRQAVSKLICTGILMSFCQWCLALELNPTLYGRVNLSYESVTDDRGSYFAMNSNNSKIGIKGEEDVNEGLTALYLLDYQVDYDDADTFRQLNIYIGLKGQYGTGLAGYFDTPLRRAQNKVDLFNFMRGDIRNIVSVNENRRANTLMYISPNFHHWNIYVAHMASEDPDVKDGKSFALAYQNEHWYGALAYEQDVEEEGANAVRAVAQYQKDRLQLGFLAEQYEAESTPELGTLNAWFASIKYKFSDVWVGRAQAGLSDIVYEGGTTMSLGMDYIMNADFRFYGFFTSDAADDAGVEGDYLGLGLFFTF